MLTVMSIDDLKYLYDLLTEIKQRRCGTFDFAASFYISHFGVYTSFLIVEDLNEK